VTQRATEAMVKAACRKIHIVMSKNTCRNVRKLCHKIMLYTYYRPLYFAQCFRFGKLYEPTPIFEKQKQNRLPT
jgi:hypothetical protein